MKSKCFTLLLVSLFFQIAIAKIVTQDMIDSINAKKIDAVKCDLSQRVSVGNTSRGSEEYELKEIESVVLKAYINSKGTIIFDDSSRTKHTFDLDGMETKEFYFGFDLIDLDNFGIQVTSAKGCDANNLLCLGESPMSSLVNLSKKDASTTLRFSDYYVNCKNIYQSVRK